MAKTKKLLSVFLALLMMLTVFPTSIIASAANAATVTVESVNAVPGSNVEVNINVKNNPGILAANFTVTYDKGLTLIDSKSGDAFSALSMTKPENYNSPCKFGWDALEIADEDIKDGTILTLTFSVDKNVSANTKLNVKLSYQNGNIIDSNLNDIPVTINNGSVTIIDYIPGDINGDGTIDLKDVTLVRRLVTGYGVTANKLAADVNGDGEITMKDVVLIRRYVVDAEGYGVTLVPGGSNVHTHTMTATAAKSATCTENGNIAYWYCSSCEKYFTDKDGNNVVSQADTVIKAKGHTIVIDAAVDPTYDSTGLTEGSHCSTCKAVLKKQEIIPKLQKAEYSITYHISNGDEYLAQQTIQNVNPTTYTSEQGVSKFANPSVPGYQFLGWYDLPSGDAAENIKSIPAGTTGNIDLYARWEKLSYKVNFSSELIPVASETYTVDEEHVLPSPKLDGYIFSGWSDDNGNVIKTIPAGTVGAKTYAHWTKNPTSDWVLESALPEGASVVDQKWTYDLTSKTSSSSSSMSGWTKYDTKRTGWGATQGPVYSNPSNGSRNVWSEQYETGRTHHYVYYHYANSAFTSFSYAQSNTYCNYREYDVTSALTYHKDYSGHAGYRYYHNGTNYYIVWLSREYDDVSYGTRWYYQEPVYTYYYKKTEAKESSTEVKASDSISNVQKYVKYINK